MSDARNGTPAGDMDPEAFRREAHRVADWIADYLAAPERYPVLAQVRPGDLVAALPASAPEHGEPFDAIFAVNGADLSGQSSGFGLLSL